MTFEKEKIKALIRESWAVSWPMTMIMLFIFFIGFCDVYIAGRFGKDIQAAYGLSFQTYFILNIISAAISVGTVSIISRLFTSHKKNECREAIDSSLIVAAGAGSALAVIGFFLAPFVMRIFHVPQEIEDTASVLMRIYSVGLIFHYLLLNSNGILRACGMIRKSLVTMAVVAALNVGLNFVLSLKTPLGFRGIALSTVISTAIGVLINFAHARSLIIGKLRFSLRTVKRIIGIGWPAAMLQVFWQMGTLTLFFILSILPARNVEIMAAFTNGIRIEAAIFLPAFAFNLANAVVVGNLLGKGDREDTFTGGIVTAMVGVSIVMALTALVLFNARAVASILSDNAAVIRETMTYIKIAFLFEPVMAWSVILGGGLNGSGDTRGVMIIIALCVWLVRVPLSYFFGVYMGFGPVAVWWSMNASLLAQAIFITRRYFNRNWIAQAQRIIVE